MIQFILGAEMRAAAIAAIPQPSSLLVRVSSSCDSAWATTTISSRDACPAKPLQNSSLQQFILPNSCTCYVLHVCSVTKLQPSTLRLAGLEASNGLDKLGPTPLFHS